MKYETPSIKKPTRFETKNDVPKKPRHDSYPHEYTVIILVTKMNL